MRQRVQLAQALVHDPRLLLLDEPTNGLDPAGRDEMLELIERTGHEFGIAIILASHLLGEIEEVCDFLVAIDAGRLLRAAPLAEFTTETGLLTVEVEEGRDALAARLGDRGLRVLADGGGRPAASRSRSTTASRTTSIRDAVAELGLPLVRIERRRHSLEDLFRDGGPTEPPDRGDAARPAMVADAAGSRRTGGRRRWRTGRPMTTGSIYDLGYRGYDGPRLGRRHAVATLVAPLDAERLRDRPERPGEDPPGDLRRAARAHRPRSSSGSGRCRHGAASASCR